MADILSPSVFSLVRKNVPLARYSTLGVGGPADYFAEILDEFDLSDALFEILSFARGDKLDFFILGGGSNVLFGDKGFRGLVILMRYSKVRYDRDDDTLWVGAGAKVSHLVKFAAIVGMTGLECFAGLPGTVGGAVHGNAGCYGGQFWDIVEEVKFLDGLDIKEIKTDSSLFGYRWSFFKNNPQYIILSVRLKIKPGDMLEVWEKTGEIFKRRQRSQPKVRSAGCIFKNPDKSVTEKTAGQLIEEAGLKGRRIGGAQISKEHANFFVNLGWATAADFLELIKGAKSKVLERFGVLLEEEIIRVGEF